MKPISFEDAVRFAVDYLDKNSVQTAREDILRQLKFRFAARTGLAGLDENGNRAPTEPGFEAKSVDELLAILDAPLEDSAEAKYRLAFTGEDSEALERLIELSSGSSIAFDALLDVASSMARHGLPFQGKMREWVSGYLHGEFRKTPRTGRIRAETLGRDLYIIGAIYELTERGLPATRNDASPATSACDAVAEACRRIGVAPRSFQSVKRIWNNAERVLRCF